MCSSAQRNLQVHRRPLPTAAVGTSQQSGVTARAQHCHPFMKPVPRFFRCSNHFFYSRKCKLHKDFQGWLLSNHNVRQYRMSTALVQAWLQKSTGRFIVSVWQACCLGDERAGRKMPPTLHRPLTTIWLARSVRKHRSRRARIPFCYCSVQAMPGPLSASLREGHWGCGVGHSTRSPGTRAAPGCCLGPRSRNTGVIFALLVESAAPCLWALHPETSSPNEDLFLSLCMLSLSLQFTQTEPLLPGMCRN